MRKSRSLLVEHNLDVDRLGNYRDVEEHVASGIGGGGAGGSESYSSNSSFSDTYSDGSDLANWEEYVADDGTLFYAEYIYRKLSTTTTTTTTNNNLNNNNHSNGEKCIEFGRNNSLRLGKKSSRRHQQQQQQPQHNSKTTASNQQQQQQRQLEQSQQQQQNDVFKFSYIRPQELCKTLELVITAADRYRYGRRSTAVESILGFRVVPFPDQIECLMVHSFVHEIPLAQQQQQQQQQNNSNDEQQNIVQRGDWFKSLDNIEIRASNLDELLLQFVEPTKVCLKFQSPHLPTTLSNSEQTANNNNASFGDINANNNSSNELKKIENFKHFSEIFSQLLQQQQHISTTTSTSNNNFSIINKSNKNNIMESNENSNDLPPFAMLILPPECYQNDEHKDSLYFYPPHSATMSNFLYKTRGSFLTLNAVLSEELQTCPHTVKLLVEQRHYYVCFRTFNGFLVLYAFAAEFITLAESQLRANELIAYMRFTLPQLSLTSFVTTATDSQLRGLLQQLCLVQRTRLLLTHQRGQCLFEELLKESRHMPLPKEAQLRIFDALSEMEAMDYRNWNDEPLNTHREFFIHGSILYYDHFLLATQMPIELRQNVEGYMRCRGIFEFIASHNVKELYIWEEITLANANGRYFLTICSRNHLILAVVLKIFDAPDLPLNAVITPSLFYIEEIQETLDHLIQCGIESLAKFWSVSNKRPEVLDKLDAMQPCSEKETTKLEAFIKQKLGTNSSSNMGNAGSSATSVLGGSCLGSSNMPPRSISYDEETHLCSSLGGGSSIHSLTASEDDASKKRNNSSNLGTAAADDSDSGSDWENFAEQHPLRYGFDADVQSTMTESLWKEINNVVPVKISAGWKNSVFYYVYVDSVNSSVFCPLKANSETFPFVREMRRACHMIHAVLQQTKNFRRLLAQEAVNKATSSAAGNNNNNISSGNTNAGGVNVIGDMNKSNNKSNITANTTTGSSGPIGIINSSASNNNNNSISINSKTKGLLAIKEHGVTIEVCESISSEQQQHAQSEPKELLRGRFVVVGRLFHAPTKEVYVCHRPDVPQNMVEMAFRLSFFAVG